MQLWRRDSEWVHSAISYKQSEVSYPWGGSCECEHVRDRAGAGGVLYFRQLQVHSLRVNCKERVPVDKGEPSLAQAQKLKIAHQVSAHPRTHSQEIGTACHHAAFGDCVRRIGFADESSCKVPKWRSSKGLPRRLLKPKESVPPHFEINNVMPAWLMYFYYTCANLYFDL